MNENQVGAHEDAETIARADEQRRDNRREHLDEDLHDPEAVNATTGNFKDAMLKAYALCRGGFVVAVRTAMHRDPHPFGDVEMGVPGMTQDPKREHVVEVTGAKVYPGMIVDNKGNVAPAGSLDRPLMLDEPAYHDYHRVAPVPVTEHAEIVGRPGNDGTAEPPPASHTDARIEGRAEGDRPMLPGGHENDHGVQEHHDREVHGGEFAPSGPAFAMKPVDEHTTETGRKAD